VACENGPFMWETVPVGGKRGEDWPLVGRAAELHRLHDCVVGSDSPGVMIAGPAGVGKSRLALEGLRLAEAAGMVGVRVTATRAAAALPSGPRAGASRCSSTMPTSSTTPRPP